MNRLHYLTCYRRAIASGFDHFAHAIACLYFAEFGETMPAGNPAQLQRQRMKDSANPFPARQSLS